MAQMAQNTTPPKPGQAKEKNAPAARSFIKDDLPFIRKSLITFGVSLALCAAMVGASEFFQGAQKKDMDTAQAQRNDARSKLLQAETEKRDVLENQARYMALRERGFIGEEKRLDRMEQIKQIQQSRNLLPIAYEISAQQSFQADPSVQTGDLEIRGSKMRLQMSLLHEMDLFNLLDDLKSKGFYTVQACTIKRIETPMADLKTASLSADCTLYWLTLSERGGNPPNPAAQ